MLIPHPVGLPRLKARSNQCAVRPARRPPSGTIPSGASRTMPRVSVSEIRTGTIIGKPSAATQPSRTSGRRAAFLAARAPLIRGLVPSWWGLRRRRLERQRNAVHLGRPAAVELGPDQDPFDCNPDVEAQRPHAEPRLPQRVKVLPGFHTLPDVGTQPRIFGNWFRKGGIALDQYVFAAATRSALPGVKGDRNSRISPYPLELLPYPDRAVEHRQRARGSITKGEVCQRRQDDATRGGDVPERHDTV